MTVRAIDPSGCACTECITGEYVPLDRATSDQVIDMLAGKIANNTAYEPEIEVTVTFGSLNFVIDRGYVRGTR